MRLSTLIALVVLLVAVLAILEGIGQSWILWAHRRGPEGRFTRTQRLSQVLLWAILLTALTFWAWMVWSHGF